MHERDAQTKPQPQSVETPQALEKFHLKEGLNAIVMPDLGERNEAQEPITPRLEKAVVRLQTFLDEIDRQGGEVLAIIPYTAGQKIRTSAPNEPNHVFWVHEPKNIFIIKKKTS